MMIINVNKQKGRLDSLNINSNILTDKIQALINPRSINLIDIKLNELAESKLLKQIVNKQNKFNILTNFLIFAEIIENITEPLQAQSNFDNFYNVFYNKYNAVIQNSNIAYVEARLQNYDKSIVDLIIEKITYLTMTDLKVIRELLLEENSKLIDTTKVSVAHVRKSPTAYSK